MDDMPEEGYMCLLETTSKTKVAHLMFLVCWECSSYPPSPPTSTDCSLYVESVQLSTIAAHPRIIGPSVGFHLQKKNPRKEHNTLWVPSPIQKIISRVSPNG
jgi:hypothetical protein